MRKLFAGLIILLFAACQDQPPEEKIQFLDGYWEIDKVEIAKDSVKEYKYNETVDFFEIENGVGFRKKVRPEFDGSYKVTEDQEKIVTKIEGDELYLYYTTAFDEWREKVILAEEEKLIIENEQGIRYYYKKFTPLLNDYYETKE
jgi:hypothetical protein